jgi:hypothetical protein
MPVAADGGDAPPPQPRSFNVATASTGVPLVFDDTDGGDAPSMASHSRTPLWAEMPAAADGGDEPPPPPDDKFMGADGGDEPPPPPWLHDSSFTRTTVSVRVPLVFDDMDERERATRQRLQDRLDVLTQARQSRPSQAIDDEIENIETQLSRRAVLDPLFKEAQRAMAATHQSVGDHCHGLMPSLSSFSKNLPNADEQELGALYGILEREGHTSPDPTRSELYGRFITALSFARGEYNRNKSLFNAVLPILYEQGERKTWDRRLCDSSASVSERLSHVIPVRADQWAAVVKQLADDRVNAGDVNFKVKVLNALDAAVGGAQGPISAVEIDLPDLEAQANIEIVRENLHATQAVYFAAMLEELYFFQVREKLLEFFQNGMLPFGKGNAGELLYGMWRKSAERISETERRNHYARVFGFPGGDAMQLNPNREFNDLWLRFVSAVSAFVRQLKVDDLLRARIPVQVSQEQVRKSGRDLGANLSLHGYGMTFFVAAELQKEINDIIKLLSDPEVLNAYGARDMWQVIDQVATLELGGARNSVRYRTMAQAGAVIIRWLADHAEKLAGASFDNALDIDQIRNPPPRRSGQKPTTNPTDADLVNACEQWLAVTGTPDDRVEQYSQPIEGPNMTSRPIQIPSVAKDLLESVGVQAGMATGAGYVNGKTNY